jgi:hypothetical protein
MIFDNLFLLPPKTFPLYYWLYDNQDFPYVCVSRLVGFLKAGSKSTLGLLGLS